MAPQCIDLTIVACYRSRVHELQVSPMMQPCSVWGWALWSWCISAMRRSDLWWPAGSLSDSRLLCLTRWHVFVPLASY